MTNPIEKTQRTINFQIKKHLLEGNLFSQLVLSI